MAVQPQVVREVAPSNAPTPYQPQVQANQPLHPTAADFGADTYAGLVNLGQGLTRAGVFFQEVGADDASNSYQEGVNKILYGDPNTVGPDGQPDSGFMGLKGRAALDARPGVTQRIEDLRKGIQGGLKTPRTIQAFDASSRRYQQAVTTRVAEHSQRESLVYSRGVNEATEKLRLDEIGANYNDPKIVGEATEGLVHARVKNVELVGGGPEQVREAIASARRDALKARLNAISIREPLLAMRIAEENRNVLGVDYAPVSSHLRPRADAQEAEEVVDSYSGLPIPQAVRQYDGLIQKAAATAGITPALGYGLISQESSGNTAAVSPAGARGLTQLMPGTARDLGVTDPHNPDQAVPAGFRYLKQQIDKYGSERLGLMAYNWGPGNLEAWIKAGSDPEKVPLETRQFVRRVQAFAASFGTKQDVKGMQLDILQRQDLPLPVRTAAATMLERRSSAYEAMRTAQVKSLNDTLEATTQAMIASPSQYKVGTLSRIADAYETAGDTSAAVNTRILARFEKTLLEFSSSTETAQKRIIEGLLPGKAKALAAGLIAADEKERGEAGKVAHSEFSAIREAIAGGVSIDTLGPKVKAAIEMAVRSGDPLLSRQILEFAETTSKAGRVAQATPTQFETMLGEARTRIEQGAQTNADIKLMTMMEETQRKQATAFSHDAFAAGTSLYPEVGKPVPLNWADASDNLTAALAMRALQARQISARRDGLAVLPFSEPEIQQLRNHLNASTPDAQAALMSRLAMLPADMLPRIAIALAGKDNASDHLSRSYAAALSLFSTRDPTLAPIASQVLQGAALMKNMGAAGKEPPTASQAWQAEAQTILGNSLRDLDPKAQAVVAASIASIYTYKMFQAGRQGDPIDTGVLDDATRTVLGTPVIRNGQKFFPPVRGMDSYGVDAAMRTLTTGDLNGAKTLEGDPVTADVVRNYGVLTNVGEGLYKVRIPDGRRRGDLAEIRDPVTGDAWILDMRPLVERAKTAPAYVHPERDYSPLGPAREIGRRYLPRPEPAP